MTNMKTLTMKRKGGEMGDGRWNSESSMMNTSGEAFRIGY
jgi:hypothetical protein